MLIYQTYRNADQTEGRGPMEPDLAFFHKEHAERFIDEQPGIMGRREKWSQLRHGDWVVMPEEHKDCDINIIGRQTLWSHGQYGDRGIRRIEVVDYDVIEEQLGQ